MAETPALAIRPARKADAELILAFIRELAEFENLLHEVVATTDDIEHWLFGERNYAEVVIAEWGGGPAGFALFFSNFSTFLATPGIYLEDLYVRPEFRGRGIGQALLKRVAKLAVERGFKRLDWWVLHWNRPAIDFYRGAGARAMDDWVPYRLDGAALVSLAAQD
jgi:GNAT superfamily N-acetyltransferase